MASYRLLRMEPTASDIPGHPEVVGRLDVNPGDGWPPVVALFVDVGNTAPHLVSEYIEDLRRSIVGLFPEGRTLFVPHRGDPVIHLYRLEEEPPDVPAAFGCGCDGCEGAP